MVIVPEGNKKKALIGTRMASTKEKESEHADRDGHEEAFEKAASILWTLRARRRIRHEFGTSSPVLV